MANENKSEIKIYTPSEVVEILSKAKELGIVYIRLAGFDAGFNVQQTPAAPPIPQDPMAQLIAQAQRGFQQPQQGGDGLCVQCGAPTQQYWHQFCMNCFPGARRGRGSYGRGRRY